MKISLQWKIATNMWALAALCTLVAMATSSWLIIKNQKRNIEQQLKTTATTLVSLGISDYHGLEGFEKLDQFIGRKLKLSSVNKVINVFTEKGKLMFSSVVGSEVVFGPLFDPKPKPYLKEHQTKKKVYKILTTPYQAKNGKIYFLQIAIPTAQYHQVFMADWKEALLLFMILSMLSFFVARMLTFKLLQPVRRVAQYVNQLNPSEMTDWRPLLLPHAGEYLHDIVTGINNLTTRTKSSLYNISRSGRYLAHEIRNPLTILTGEAETILSKKEASSSELREVLESSLEEIARMDTAISTILQITQSGKTLYRPNPCNLSKWLHGHVPQWEKHLNSNICWEKPVKDMLVFVDEFMLYRLMDNLVRNIKKHTSPNICCNIKLIDQGKEKKILIEDQGQGISADLLEYLNRQDPSHPQMGTGLSICLEIASICNFKLHFENKPKGGVQVIVII